MKKSKAWFLFFVGPIFLAFLLVVLIPLFRGIYLSFTDWNGISSNINIVGFENYVKVFKDQGFKEAFLFTFKFAIVLVVLVNLLGFLLALLVTQKISGTRVLRSIFFMPNLIGGLILGFVWQFIFVKVFNSIGELMNLSFLEGWLSNTETGFWGLMILMIWQMSGYLMIIYIAALQNIPKSLIEAAKIDGASKWHRLRYIIIPMVMPAFTIGLFLSLANAFKLFDQNLALTNGGPYGSTEMLALDIYKTAFVRNDLGFAQAKAVIFLIVVSIITLTQLYITKKREVEF